MNFAKRKQFHDTILVENASIFDEPLEIDVSGKVKIERDRNFVSIYLTPPLEDDIMDGGIRLPNGEISNPVILLVDEFGHEYILEYSGSRGKRICNYEYEGLLPKDRDYQKIILKSDFLIRTEKIVWSGYDLKDRK